MDRVRVGSFALCIICSLIVAVWPGWRVMHGMSWEQIVVVGSAPFITAVLILGGFFLVKVLEY